MNNRRQYSTSELDNVSTADKLFAQNKNFVAFDYYQHVLTNTQNQQLAMYCRARMLSCQCNGTSVNFSIILERANELIRELEPMSAADARNLRGYRDYEYDVKNILRALEGRVQKIKYLHTSVRMLINTINNYMLAEYASAFELDVNNFDQVMQRLNEMYIALTNCGHKSQLTADLLVTMGSAYFDHSNSFGDDNQEKKKCCQQAKEKFEQAFLYCKTNSFLPDISWYLKNFQVLTELYDLAELEDNENDRTAM